MGKRDRERIEQILAGNIKPIAILNNAVGRTITKLAARNEIVKTMQEADLPEQLEFLSKAPANRLGRALMSKAPHEMDKGIKKLRSEGKPVTVDALTEEVRTAPGFLRMSEQAGVPLSWYENLARERMKANGI